MNLLEGEDLSAVAQKALRQGVVNPEDSAAIFFDMSYLAARISALKSAFPPATLHTSAIKANPLMGVLKFIRTQGMGAEAASMPELILALRAGFEAQSIVFDSPVKTCAELKEAMRRGVHINADSLSELERIAELRKTVCGGGSFGVRINPQVGSGSLGYVSTAGTYSKFGVALKENREAIFEAFCEYDWLSGVHLHVGSQTCAVEMIAEGIGTVCDFALEVNRYLQGKGLSRRVQIFDMGGGLPVKYLETDKKADFGEFTGLLKKRSPELFSGDFKLITEFGRSLHANAGWAISRVEYLKTSSGMDMLMTHLGADMFVRECYRPGEWPHRVFLLDASGRLKKGGKKAYCIAGPLCFSGDVIAREVMLGEAEPGDFVAICDCGAYTFSMWSKYNSRQMPKVVGYWENGREFQILRQRESAEQAARFWGE